MRIKSKIASITVLLLPSLAKAVWLFITMILIVTGCIVGSLWYVCHETGLNNNAPVVQVVGPTPPDDGVPYDYGTLMTIYRTNTEYPFWQSTQAQLSPDKEIQAGPLTGFMFQYGLTNNLNGNPTPWLTAGSNAPTTPVNTVLMANDHSETVTPSNLVINLMGYTYVLTDNPTNPYTETFAFPNGGSTTSTDSSGATVTATPRTHHPSLS